MSDGIAEDELTGPWKGFAAAPVTGGGGAGVLVLSGSSGRIERERCRLFARAGVTAVSVRWFGGAGQPPGVCEVPLETFADAAGLLRERGAARVSLLGTSKGAEAALLVAALTGCADAVIALAPTSVCWANVGPGRDGRDRPYRSSWTWRGRPVPFVPLDGSWTPSEPEGAPVAVRGWYERSLVTYADLLPAAAIPVERAVADLVLVAGGADRMWPSARFAGELAARRTAAGRGAAVVVRADAGHRTVFPGESAPPPSPRFDHGGTPEADAALGAEAWPHVLSAVRGGA
ncbi:acyl-CoA thioester hydrolase/BAAT C-terminal domain-containing protein [Streptomyces sp. RFCAC02]|uniref:acyl-CoA thioester hydrolase/BAAT C-terminal domain-containing protein n=1 Tax=Streptomyces sp. RFCAC02 TaxID=2499143 RepID=UPI0010224D6A|nr:acyl-CoA thioester hydrolase/BAAT C-terminal domain-containing protein [Streptomyces sp. RFCAC02]